MPYKCYSLGGEKWEVKNTETGKKYGTHDSLKSCITQQRLLYMAESGKKPTGKKGKPFRVHKGK